MKCSSPMIWWCLWRSVIVSASTIRIHYPANWDNYHPLQYYPTRLNFLLSLAAACLLSRWRFDSLQVTITRWPLRQTFNIIVVAAEISTTLYISFGGEVGLQTWWGWEGWLVGGGQHKRRRHSALWHSIIGEENNHRDTSPCLLFFTEDDENDDKHTPSFSSIAFSLIIIIVIIHK